MDPNKIKLAQTFGASRGQLLTKVVLPGSVPTLIAALKVNVGLSLVGVVVGEFQSANVGLGYLIQYGSQIFKLNIVMTAITILAIISSLVQLLSSRQMLPPIDPRTADDANVKTQRQMAYFLPFISILYGGIVPAGLMLYWIASSVFSIGQQFLVLGFGGMFPLFGYSPQFAQGYRPRYHVTLPEPKPVKAGSAASAAERSKAVDRDLSARSTIRPNPNNRAKSGRRGRRR